VATVADLTTAEAIEYVDQFTKAQGVYNPAVLAALTYARRALADPAVLAALTYARRALAETEQLRDDLAHAQAHIAEQAAQIRRLTSGRPTTIAALQEP